MKRAPDGLGPVITLDRRRAVPLHRQIYESYREAILEGRLRPRQRLPSTRALAQDLAVSRISVVTAFAQLVAEGYVESRVGAGTVVSAELPDARPAGAGRRDGPLRKGLRRVRPSVLPVFDEPWLALRGPFRLSEPALDEFPAALWSRLATRHVRRMPAQHMVYGDPMGLPALREALAAHLRTFRSVACTADQIMIVSGSQQALALTWRALLEPGEAAWLEEPGYHGARDALLLAGVKIVPVPVDDDGLDVETGIRRADRARGVYVTPAHQYPLGVAMSVSRRMQLLDWACRRGAWIVEDDYDSEYRYDGRPLAALQGLIATRASSTSAPSARSCSRRSASATSSSRAISSRTSAGSAPRWTFFPRRRRKPRSPSSSPRATSRVTCGACAGSTPSGGGRWLPLSSASWGTSSRSSAAMRACTSPHGCRRGRMIERSRCAPRAPVCPSPRCPRATQRGRDRAWCSASGRPDPAR